MFLLCFVLFKLLHFKHFIFCYSFSIDIPFFPHPVSLSLAVCVAAESAVSASAHPGRERFVSGGRNSSSSFGFGPSEADFLHQLDPDQSQHCLSPRYVRSTLRLTAQQTKLLKNCRMASERFCNGNTPKHTTRSENTQQPSDDKQQTQQRLL